MIFVTFQVAAVQERGYLMCSHTSQAALCVVDTLNVSYDYTNCTTCCHVENFQEFVIKINLSGLCFVVCFFAC